MKTFTLIASATAIVLATSAGVLWAKQGHRSTEAHADRAVAHISKRLQLTDAQEQSLDVLKDQMIELRQRGSISGKGFRNELRELVAADSFNQGEALELITQRTDMINQAAPEFVASLGTFLDGLEPAQKEQVLELMSKRQGRGHGKWHRSRGDNADDSGDNG